MTTRQNLVEDLQGVESILCALEGVGPDIPDRKVILMLSRVIYHILEFLIRRTTW